MFENILHQDRACGALRDDIAGGVLPQALLFEGPEYAGKLSAALELVRVLSCQRPGAPWGCSCNACAQHKYLVSPYLALLGRRYFGREIRACGQALLAEDREASRFLLLRAVRKLLKRFDPLLWENESKLAAAAKHVEKAEEKLEPLLPGKPALSPGEAGAQLDAIYEACDSLAGLLPQDGVGIAMVRRVVYWAHTADASQRKFIVVENAEQMNESTRNSLLKVLEEPPPGVYFLLLTSRRSAIMPTILSRVRPYSFQDRGPGDQAVLERIFRRKPGEWPSLDAFFARMRGADLPAATEGGVALAEGLLRRAGLAALAPAARPVDLEATAALVGKDRDCLDDLVRAAAGRLCRGLADIEDPAAARRLGDSGLAAIQAVDRVQALVRRLNAQFGQAKAYNLGAAAFLERLYHDAANPTGT